MVRIFVSPSHLCTLYMILYARATRKEGHKDVLILDSPAKKNSLIALIKGTQKLYPWHTIIDLSTALDDSTELVADTKKKLTRKLKTRPVFKQVYDALLARHNKKLRNAEAKIISEKVTDLGEVAEVNLVTQTQVNEALFMLYPNAQVNYFEHGIGDYYYVQNVRKQNFNFYCVFAEPFKKLLTEKGLAAGHVRQLAGLENFPALAKEVIGAEGRQHVKIEGKVVMLLLENMQLYHVPDNYYTNYIDLCMSQVKDPQNYTFIIKPHPAQTKKSMHDQHQRLRDHYKVRTVLLEAGQEVNFSAEVLFSIWSDQAEYFFSNISSAGFYAAVLYKNSGCRFFYSYDFFLDYIQNAPKQFKDAYLGSEEYIKKVFGANCIAMK